MVVASVLGFVGVCAIVGRLAGGAASDTIGREWAFTLFYSCTLLGILSLLFLKTESAWLLPVYVVFGGLGLGTGAAMYPAMLADLFPGPNLGKVMGFTSFFAGVGSGFGPFFVGYLHDLTGSYTSGLTFLLFPLIAAIFFVWIAAPRKSNITV
jgi:MFS family permease